jgi:hypothetical protein
MNLTHSGRKAANRRNRQSLPKWQATIIRHEVWLEKIRDLKERILARRIRIAAQKKKETPNE